MRLPGGPYTSKALGQLLVNVRGQWAGFEPLSQDFRDYTSAVNKLTHGNTGGGSVDTSITSIKPVLIAIDPLGPNAYSVVSLRTYNFTAGSRALKSVKVDADAVALVHTTLVRLTLLRDARSAEDVTDAKAQIPVGLVRSPQRKDPVDPSSNPRIARNFSALTAFTVEDQKTRFHYISSSTVLLKDMA